ncbi:MAG: hypothetical protein N4A41_14545 [Crocinitomicaceae bacterium]|jgi:uncharacterized membrane protein|nr:hypothetical protein [Crocinitomicaceae bacterium]
MGSSSVFYAIADFMYDYAFIPFEYVGNMFNYAMIVLGFFGMLYWLNWQRKFNEQAKNNPGQLK